MLGIKGFGSELSLILLVILIFDKILIPLYINWKKDKRLTLRTQRLQLAPVANNPHAVKPGDGKTCKENRERIIRLEVKLKELCKDIEKMEKNGREDHRLIFEKIDEIKDKRR